MREECSHCPASPMYLGSSIHFSCGLEVSSFRFHSRTCEASSNRIEIAFTNGFGVTMSACCYVYILLPLEEPVANPLTNLIVSGCSYRPNEAMRIMHRGTWHGRHSVVVAIPCDLSKRRRGLVGVKGEDKSRYDSVETDLQLEW